MSACGDFWFWFTRPFAEFLGGVALLAVIVVIVLLGLAIASVIPHRKNRP
jgi:hypothetical protein